MFSCKICEIFKNSYCEEHLRTAAYVLSLYYGKPLQVKESFDAITDDYWDTRNEKEIINAWLLLLLKLQASTGFLLNNYSLLKLLRQINEHLQKLSLFCKRYDL